MLAVWLPMDAKFPLEDYQRMLEAQTLGGRWRHGCRPQSAREPRKALCKDIQGKYIDPPHTTDFGIMFLPTEGLYAEVLRRPGSRGRRAASEGDPVIIAGPTTLAALLDLQMGFRTLAMEKRSSEVSSCWAR